MHGRGIWIRLLRFTWRRRLRAVAEAIVLLLLLPLVAVAETNPDLDVVSKHYIVIDAETGEIFAQHKAHDPVPLASLTKIFTAIEAIEEAPPDYAIETTAADMVDGEATQVGFGPGETFTLQDLTFGMMLPSGNDAARAIARSLGAADGDSPEQAVARFMARINQRVVDMGLTETTLVNPDGWGVPGHASSAHDIAAFTRYALQYPRFVEAFSQETYETSTGGYRLVNTDKRLGLDDDLLGGKTGYDDTAGYCLMQVARQGGSTMIAVTLDGVAPDVWYDDNRALLDYAFAEKAARGNDTPSPDTKFAAFLDPDAAGIGRIAQSSASLGPKPSSPIKLSEGLDAPSIGNLPAPLSPAQAQMTSIARPPGVSGHGLMLAVTVALLLTSLSVFRVWRPGGGMSTRGSH